ncbi:hypothetical protein VFPPC_15781 [Pochonia chlamydosporia 170]|uniref:Uncharacterized protein n=1 Tax=Pochonia chlamydosporia 170 TaxID=1380566 RepID=A0A179FR30_METCM|nr:hypothetical protein VFPPC_15781 [Pochonia chlamydosporia 170]OAQ68086.1 hypothetical protein VFPPC_15781 [Pochonia chlamydosporia 170]
MGQWLRCLCLANSPGRSAEIPFALECHTPISRWTVTFLRHRPRTEAPWNGRGLRLSIGSARYSTPYSTVQCLNVVLIKPDIDMEVNFLKDKGETGPEGNCHYHLQPVSTRCRYMYLIWQHTGHYRCNCHSPLLPVTDITNSKSRDRLQTGQEINSSTIQKLGSHHLRPSSRHHDRAILVIHYVLIACPADASTALIACTTQSTVDAVPHPGHQTRVLAPSSSPPYFCHTMLSEYSCAFLVGPFLYSGPSAGWAVGCSVCWEKSFCGWRWEDPDSINMHFQPGTHEANS